MMKKLFLLEYRRKQPIECCLFILMLLFLTIELAAAQTVEQTEFADQWPPVSTIDKNKIKVDEAVRREILRNLLSSSKFDRKPDFVKESVETVADGFANNKVKNRERLESIERTAEKVEGKFETEDIPQTESRARFHWKPALIQSGIFLGIQHVYRLKQEKTRRELGGPFFRDWRKSVKGLSGWRDSDGFFINYIAHPLQGSLTGRIFVNNSDRAKRTVFGMNKEYWKGRFKAFVWSAAWSTQFELGPFSEASIGNVGIRKKRGRSTMAYVDLVITPTLGTGVLVAEDAIDKYILKNWLEKKNEFRLSTKIKILRCVLTPTTCFANILRGKMPWKRDFR